jgi:nitroreductase
MNSKSDLELEKILNRRRSIRIFDRSPVPEEVMRKSLELAFLSPSSSNLQPWQFIRVKGRRAEVDSCFLKQTAAVSAPELIIVVARPDKWKESNTKLLGRLLASGVNMPPHFDYLTHYHGRLVPFGHDRGFLGLKGFVRYGAIWILGWLQPVIREGFFAAPLRERAVKSTALACQTFMLAITEQGYDSCPMEGFDSARLRRLLGLPRAAAIVMGIAVGKKHPHYTPPNRTRFNYDEAVLDFQ